MIPSRLLMILTALMVLPLSLGWISSDLAQLALLLNLVLVAVAALDLLLTPGPQRIEIERKVSPILSVGTRNPASLNLRNTARTALTIELQDDPGDLCEVEDLPQTITLGSWKEGSVHYAVVPNRRGATHFNRVHLRYPTMLGLWQRVEERPIRTPVRIYPDVRAVHRYELMARKNRLSDIGVRVVRMPGQGREFERLREYRFGDEQRQIDWKATARHQDLISREFNVERNQNLVVMIDSSRFMRAETEGISYLDRALNSAIMLSYIALGQGDNVALMAFSNKVERFIKPVRGKPGIQTILSSLYDVEASSAVADYSLAFEYLSRQQRKRALVILITFITDEQQLAIIGESLRLRSLPYLPMCVMLQDVGLRSLADSVPESDLDAFNTAAAAEMLAGQMAQVAQLREAGIMMVDTPPNLLTERMINEYLTIKARNLI